MSLLSPVTLITPGTISGAGAHSMDAAYNGGSTVTVDNGAIVYNALTADGAHVLELNKSPSGASGGNALDITVAAPSSGHGIAINYVGPTGRAVDIIATAGRQFRAAQSTADATNKQFYMNMYHYTQGGTPEEDVAIFVGSSTSSSNNVWIGGGSSLLNAATSVKVYTAANVTTLTGTEAIRWDNNQRTIFAAQMRGPDGSTAIPTYSFTNYTSHGIYATVNAIDIAVSGTRVMRVSGGGVGVQVNPGTLANPGLNASNDSNTGVYWTSPDIVSISTGGVNAVTWNASQQTLLPDGVAATPSLAFSSDPDTGLMWVATGIMSLVRNGSEVFRTFGSWTGIGFVGIGTAAQPRIAQVNNVTTGIFWPGIGANEFAISTNATEAVRWNASQQTLVPDGSASAPSYTFTSEQSGMYLAGTAQLSFAVTGTKKLGFNGSLWTMTGSFYPEVTDLRRIGASGTRWLVAYLNRIDIAQVADTSGTPPSSFLLTEPAHTNLTLSTEYTAVDFNMSSTVTFATGAIATQRAVRFQAPTYAFAAASTITDAATVAISGPPAEGAFATFTNSAALLIESGQILVPDGVTAAPSYSFSGATGSGWFREPDDDIVLARSGTNRITVQASTIVVPGTISMGTSVSSVKSLVADGLAATPSYSFSNFTGHGWFASTNFIEASVGGVLQFRIAGNGSGVQIGNGTAANPGLNARNDTTSGVFWDSGANAFAVSTNGTEAVRWNSSQQSLMPDGLTSTPSYSFANDTDTGMRLAGVGSLAFTVAGLDRATMNSGAFTMVGTNFRVQDNFEIQLGSGATDGTIGWNTTQTAHAIVIGTAPAVTGGNLVILCETADIGFNFGHAAQTNPTLIIHSAAQSTDEWLSLTHDGTQGFIDVGGTDALVIDTTLKVRHASGINIQTAAGTGYCSFLPRPDTGLYIAIVGTDTVANNNLILVNSARSGDAYIHNPTSLDPTLIIHSDTAAVTSTTEWGSLAFSAASGTFNIATGSGYTVIGTAGTVTSHSAGAGGLVVGGIFEANDQSYFDAGVHHGNNTSQNFGASDDFVMSYRTSPYTNASMAMSMAGVNSKTLMVINDNFSFDHAPVVATNPTLKIFSANNSTTEWISAAHDQTSAVLNSGTAGFDIQVQGTSRLKYVSGTWQSGDDFYPDTDSMYNLGSTGLRWLSVNTDELNVAGMTITNDGAKTTFDGPAGDYYRFGNAAIASHVSGPDDLLVTNDLEVSDIIFNPGMPRIFVNLSASMTATTNAFVLFNNTGGGGTTATNDVSGITFTSTDGRFTVDSGGDGRYVIIVTALMNHSGGGTMDQWQLTKNVSTAVTNSTLVYVPANNATQVMMAVYVDLVATDYVRVIANANGANTLQARAGTNFIMYKIA